MLIAHRMDARTQVSRFPERGDALMKKDAQLPALDETVPVDEAAMALTGQAENTEAYFAASNTEGDDSGVTLDSIRMEDASVSACVPACLRAVVSSCVVCCGCVCVVK